MAETSSIEWTDATWNPVTGCSIKSPGCRECYAMELAATRLRNHPSRAGLTHEVNGHHVWTGEVRFNEQWLDQPLRWRAPRMIFVCAHGDLFHEDVPDEWIDRVFAVMALAPQHVFQVLTKRADRMRAWFEERWQGTPARDLDLGAAGTIHVPAGGETGRMVQVEQACEAMLDRFNLNDPDKDDLWTEDGKCKAMQWQWPLRNVWLGVSVEDQKRADERIPGLLATPAAVRFLSCEPLLGPVNLRSVRAPRSPEEPVEDLEIDWRFDALEVGDYYWFDGEDGQPGDCGDGPYRDGRIDWVIAGGESGPNARPMHPDWARELRDQCARATIHGDDAPVPFFFKQWGAWAPANLLSDGTRLETVFSAGMALPNGIQTTVAWPDGRIEPGHEADHGGKGIEMRRLGKKAAGRLLDGVEHGAQPEANA